jgi:acyl carrier protein
MTMTNVELLKLFNIIGIEAIDDKTKFKEITNADLNILDMGLDSLDFITMFIYMGDIFDMPDEDFNKHPLMATDGPIPTFNNLIAVIEDVGNNLDITYDEAIKEI